MEHMMTTLIFDFTMTQFPTKLFLVTAILEGQTRKFSSLCTQFQLSLVGISKLHLNAQNVKLNWLNNEGTLCHV